MSAPEATKNRAGVRLRSPSPNVRDQQLASLCVLVASDTPQREGEQEAHYMRRVRDRAKRILRDRRRAAGKTAHATRVTNQKAARAARKGNR